MEYRSWGEAWNAAIKLSKGLDCPSCGWAWLGKPLEKYNSIGGFSTERPFATRGLGGKAIVGIVIIECPSCFEKYSFHVDAPCIKCCQDYCDIWPK